MIGRCLKILVMVSLAALALRATSLLGGGYVEPPCPSSESSGPELQSMSGGGVSVSSYRRNRRRMEGALAALDARRFRHHVGGGGLEADKRLAPTGSNPLHNLR